MLSSSTKAVLVNLEAAAVDLHQRWNIHHVLDYPRKARTIIGIRTLMNNSFINLSCIYEDQQVDERRHDSSS
jgi:hypothetical protein